MRYNAVCESKNLSLYNTPVSLKKYLLSSYLSGFSDGEGCFCISLSKSTRHRFGWEIRPSFSVSQNKNRREVIDILYEYFECGNIRDGISDNTVKFEVRSLSGLLKKVIPHFDQYPIISAKRKDFILFKKICMIMKHQGHLTEAGFRKIIGMASKMNKSGGSKRKFNLLEIKI